MIQLIPHEPHHLQLMTPQPGQEHEVQVGYILPGRGWTVTANGLPICVGDVFELWPGRAHCNALLAADAGPHMLGLTRAIRFLLADLPYRRIEMVVEAGFEPGRRWARLLGFELETPKPLRQYLPGGRSAWLYARINDGMGAVHSAGDAGRGRPV